MNAKSEQSLDETAQERAILAPGACEILDFWFGAPGSAEYGGDRALWFSQSDAIDAVIRSRFEAVHESAMAGQCDAWARTPLGACALIVLLDQFSRNLYRGTARAFASDARALEVALTLVGSAEDRCLPTPYHRWFVYMPFEHDESMHGQRESVRLFEVLKSETGLSAPLTWALKHAEVMTRFGRYPHRNAILGRVSSAEEEAFLHEPGSSF
ncbi:DUF924 family protein [Mycoavidus sp. B2-EB]|uniref:DUF924 family protein n=1 Tax=Mycoavidus sp. B2-EB TaxID=2651972 RepID=UPI001623414E|nr:DUF924 family protein [Mycoavidus sp. B2-EB]BBO60202.1 hypothetical protein MPB2EB_1342 [Mycoavidus sp. B2-EB]